LATSRFLFHRHIGAASSSSSSFFYVLTCNFHIVDLLLNVDSGFGSNNFTGSLPSELGNLVKLEQM
jgi:hypothetical protein